MVQTALNRVLSSNRKIAIFARAFDQCKSAVYVDVILDFASLHLRLASIVTFGTFDDQFVYDVGQDLTR